MNIDNFFVHNRQNFGQLVETGGGVGMGTENGRAGR